MNDTTETNQMSELMGRLVQRDFDNLQDRIKELEQQVKDRDESLASLSRVYKKLLNQREVHWIPIKDSSEIPKGVWLIRMSHFVYGSNISVAVIHKDGGIIAGRFASDGPNVTGYSPIPESLKEAMPRHGK